MSHWLDTYGYFGLALGLVLEATIGVGVVVPGLTILVAAGFFAGTGALNLPTVLGIAWASVLAGDTLGYSLGRFGNARSARVREVVKAITLRIDLDSPPKWIYFFHFPVVTRSTVPVAYGAMRLPFRRWIAISAIASATFVSVVVLIGYVLGQTSGIDAANDVAKAVQAVFLALFIAVVGTWFVKRRRARDASDKS